MSGALASVALAYITLINLFAFGLFAADKRAAIAGRRRVPERVFLTLGAVGATPALLVGTRAIRHKTRKEPFRTLLIALAVLQAAVALALLVWG